MNKELWDWGDEQQEQESQAPKRSLFDNLGDAITAIGANFSDVRGSNNIGDLRHELMENGATMPLEEYNRKVAELEQLYGEREASRQKYQQAHDNLVADDSFLKNIDQLGGTLEGMAAQGIGTAVGAGLGLVGGVGGAAMGAKIGNAAGAVAGGYLDARSVALQAEEDVLDNGGTWEQAKRAYDEALKKASLTTLPETLADIALGNRLVRAGLNSGMARKIAGSTIGRAGSAVLDPAARLGTKAAFKAGNTLVGRGVGLATDIAMQGSTEALQEVTQDYIGNRETAKALGQEDNEYSLGGFKDYALSDQGLETMKTAGIMGALFGGAGGALSSGQYLTRGAETNTGIRAHNNAEQMINDGSLKISAEKRRDEEKIISVLKGISPAELSTWSDAEIVAEASILEGQYMGVQGEAEDLSTVRGAADVVRRLSDENTGVHREGDLTETTNKFLEGMGVDKEQRQRMFNSPAEMSIIEQARKAQEAEAQAKTQAQEQEGTQKKSAPVTATLTKKTAETMPKTEDGTITTKTDETQAQTPQANTKATLQPSVATTQQTATPKAVTETPSQKSAANNLEQAAQVQAQQGQITTALQNYKDNIGGGWETDPDRLDESLDEHPYYNLKTGAEVTIKHRADGQYAVEGTSGEPTVHPTLKDAEQYLKDHKDQTVFQGTNGEETEETKEGTVEDPNIVPKGGVNAREGFSGQLISSVDDLYNFMLQNPNLISRGAFIEYVHAKHNIGFDNIDIYLDKKNEGRVYDSKTGKWGYVNAKKTRDEATGRAILQLYKGADFISAVHEIAHIGYDNLTAAEQRTFDKYAVKSMGQWIADMLDLNYDDAFKQRLNNLQNDQELQEKINKSPALRQTVIEFLNAEQNGIDLNNLTKNQREAIDERWAWEFSLWYTEGYTRGVQPKNVVERLLQRGCLSIIDELEGLHRLWEHIHHKDNNEIEDLYRNMGTSVEQQAEEQAQATETATTATTEQQPTETQSNNLPVVGLDINNFGGEQAIQFNVPTLGESYNEASRRAGYYNDAREKQWNLYRMRNLPSADGSVATNTRNVPDGVDNRNISAPVESTYQNYVENDPNNFSDTDIKDLIQIGKDRSGKNRQRSRWARELLKQINPERVRRLDKEIADAQNTVNRMVDNTIEQDRQRQAQEKENNRRAEEQQRLNEYMDNYANEVMAQQVSAQNLTNKNENATVEQKREVANNGKTENTRGTENLQGNVGEVQGRGRVRSGNDNRTGEGRDGQNAVEGSSEGDGKNLSLLKNKEVRDTYNKREQKKTELKDWRNMSDSDKLKQIFVDALNASKDADMQHGVYVDAKSVEELKDCKVVLHKNKMAGFAITKDGNIVAVFSNPKNPIRGVLNDMIFIAHMMGGNRMDCFGNFLLRGYRACGFMPVARTKFAEEYYPSSDPRNATIRKEQPDVFFLVRENDNNETYLNKINNGEYKEDDIEVADIPLIEGKDSYGDALDFQGKVLKGIRKKDNANKSTKEVADSLRPKKETTVENQNNKKGSKRFLDKVEEALGLSEPVATTSEPVKTNTDNVEQTKQAKPTIPTDEIYSHLYFGDKTGKLKYNKDTKKIEYFVEEDNGRDPVTMRRRYKLVNKGEITPEQYQELRSKYEQDFKKTKGEAKDRIPNLVEGMKKEDFMYSAYRETRQSEKEKGEVAVELGKEKQTLVTGKSEEYARQNAAEQSFNKVMSGEGLSGMEETELTKEDKEEAQKQIEQELPKVEKEKTEQTTTPKTSTTTTKKTTSTKTTASKPKTTDQLSALHKKYKNITGTPIGEKGYVFKSDEKAFIEGFKGLIDGAVGNKEQLINVAKQLDSWFQNDPTERNRMVRKYLSQYLADAAQIKTNQNTEVRHQEANRAEYAQEILDKAFPNTRFQFAWHSTEHDFTEFTLDHLLSGEGAMAHGWGLYFAKRLKKNKKNYFDKLGRSKYSGRFSYYVDGHDVTQQIYNFAPHLLDYRTNDKFMAKLQEEVKSLSNELNKLRNGVNSKEFYKDSFSGTMYHKGKQAYVSSYTGEIVNKDDIDDYINFIAKELRKGLVIQRQIREHGLKIQGSNKNKLLLVDIPEDNVLLKENKEFKDQPPKVQIALMKLVRKEGLLNGEENTISNKDLMEHFDEILGVDIHEYNGDIYGTLSWLLEDDPYGLTDEDTTDQGKERCSKLLNKYGIKGISYDGRFDGECAVIFDDKAIDIITKFRQEEGKWKSEKVDNARNREIDKQKAQRKLEKHRAKDNNTRFQLHSEEGLSKADTNSPEFKKWFDGSVLTNKDGSPKIFYRGIDQHYNPEFDEEEGSVVWVTDDLEQAESYRDTQIDMEPTLNRKTGEFTGKPSMQREFLPKGAKKESGDLLEAYVSLKKPFNLGIVNDKKSPHDFYVGIGKQLQKDVKDGKITEQQMKSVLADLSYLNKKDAKGNYPTRSIENTKHFKKKFFNAFKKVGYDGVQGQEAGMFGDNRVNVYGVFDKGDIKSIYNKGTFDRNNKDTRFMYGGNQADNQTLLTPKLEKEYEKNFRNYMRLHGFSEAFIDKYFSNDKTGKEQMIPDNVLKGRNLFNKSFEEVFNEYNKQMVKDKGVKRGLDGRWRFEFSDKESKVDGKFVSNAFISKVLNDASKKYETTLQNVLKHDKLFEHYPELKEFKVIFATSKYDGLEDADGYSDFNEIALNVDSLKKEKNEKARLARIRKTLLHEVQHQIQDREGFASGGGATRRELQDRQKDFVTSYINKLGGDVETGKKLINAIEDVIKNIKKVPRNKRGALYDKIRNNAEYFGDNERDFIRKHVKAIINGYINDYQNENKKFGNYINNEIKEMCEYLSLSKDLNMNEELLKPIRQFRNVYWTTMGEIEARQTEQRADMTMEERSERTDVLDESVRKMKSFKDAPILVKETIPNIVDDEDTRFQEAAKPLTDEEIEEMDKKEEAEYKKRQKRIEDAKDSATLSDDYKDVYSVAFTKSAQGYAENRTRMEYFDNNDRYWDRTEDKSTGKVTYTRKTPFEHHQQVVTYNGVNDVTREEKKKSKPRQWLEWMKDQLIKYMFNDKHYLAKAARKLGVYDAYRKMIVTEGYALKANTALTQGIKYNGKRTRALNDIIRDVGEENQKDFIDYCIAHRIIDLANRTKLEKVSKDDKDAILIDGKYYKRVAAPVFQKMKPDEARKIIAEVKAGKNADMFEKNRKDFVEYNQALLHVLVEGGILTEKKFKEFCEVDPNFVPLAKVMDDADFGFSSIVAAHNLVNVETPIKKIGTSMREVANPFLEMQKRTAEYYSAAARNKAGQIFVNEIAEALDIKYDGNVVARGQQMINRVKVQEVNGELITKPDDKKQIIYVCNNGEHQFYQIPDREIYEALRSLDSEQMGTIHKMLDRIAHVPSGLVRETATMVPDFGVRNLIRDGGEAFLTSEHGFLPVIDQIWGMWQVANNTEWAQMYFEQNGEYGTLNREKVNAEGVASVEDVIDEKLNPLTNFNEIKKAQMAILKDKKRQFDILTDIKEGNFGDAWEHTRKSRGMAALKLAISPLWAIGKTNKRMNDLFELGTRVGEFKNAKMGFEGTLDRMAKGLLNTDIRQAKQSDIYAAHVAKDITLNFAQHGVLGKQLNRYIPFFNASLQGIYKLCNTIETMATGTTMSGGKNRKLQQELLFKAALITAMTIGVASAGDGDEDYEEAPDYEKENFWILPNGLRFPKDQVLGKVIGNTVEKSYAQWKKGKAEPSDILRAIIDNFKPDKFMPAIFDLAIGGFGNYDTFRERAIVPEYMADKLGHLQKDISTSNFAVDVSEALWKCGFNISAKKIDWALQKNFSNCAKYATSIYDLGKKGFNPKDFNERIARGYDKNDSTGAFVAGLKDDVPNPINLVSGTFATNRSTFKSISDFYENYRKYKVLSSDEASMSKEDKRIWKRYEQAYKKDMTFRKQLRAIKQDKNLTGKQKREKADKIFKQQIKLAKWAEG